MLAIAEIAAPASVCDISDTMAEPGNQPILDTLLALKPAELTANAWAKKAGVNRNIFQDIRVRDNVTQKVLEKLLDAAGASLAQYEAARSMVRTEVAGAGLVGSGEVRRAYHGEEPARPLPLLGTAIGGDHGDIDEDVELVELNLGEILDYVARPASLAGDPDAYALTILSDSMAPKFEPNDRVAVSPRQPVSIGDYVIVQLRGREGDDDRIKMVLIKRLVRRGAGFVELRQYNPDMTFRIDAKRVAAMHKVKGTLF